MAIPPSKILTPLSTLLFLAITTFAISPQTSLQSFTNCFSNNSLASAQLLKIYTPNSSSYQSVLRSSAQNLRFLASPAYLKPAAIVTAAAESDVSAAVVCARAHGLRLRTRSGGHDYEAMSYVSESPEPFVVVDLAALRRVDVDPATRTAWVQAGATLGEVYYNVFTRTGGTAGFPAGTCPTVGVGGLVSGGGIGTMSRKFGTAADSVIDARIVGVDGRGLDRKGMGEDLFWAIRGGGAASFGVVVSFRIKLVDVPPVVTTFNVYRNLRQNATKLVARWQEIARKLDPSLYIRVLARRTTDGGRPSIEARFNSLYLGKRADLLSEMAASFPELGLTAGDCAEVNWLQSVLFFYGNPNRSVLSLLDRKPQINGSFKAKSDFVTTPIAEAQWESIWEFMMNGQEEPAANLVIMEPHGGMMGQVPESATPYPHRRGIMYSIQYFLRWSEDDAQSSQRHLEFMRRLYGFMDPFVSKNPRRAYYNYKDMDLGRNDGRWSYGGGRVWGEKYFRGNFRRLALVKGRVDPGNFFRNAQSIPPLLA